MYVCMYVCICMYIYIHTYYIVAAARWVNKDKTENHLYLQSFSMTVSYLDSVIPFHNLCSEFIKDSKQATVDC